MGETRLNTDIKTTASGKRRPSGGGRLPAPRVSVGSVRSEPPTEADSKDSERLAVWLTVHRVRNETMSNWNPHERHICHDCGVVEGELHQRGCDMEKCPFCTNQLISCVCSYDQLKIDVSPGTWAYENGLTEEQENNWENILKEKGRIPYFQEPNMCARCGEVWPQMFMQDDWKAVIPPQYIDKLLCFGCYEFIKSITGGFPSP